jgi:hypothetical protein
MNARVLSPAGLLQEGMLYARTEAQRLNFERAHEAAQMQEAALRSLLTNAEAGKVPSAMELAALCRVGLGMPADLEAR